MGGVCDDAVVELGEEVGCQVEGEREGEVSCWREESRVGEFVEEALERGEVVGVDVVFECLRNHSTHGVEFSGCEVSGLDVEDLDGANDVFYGVQRPCVPVGVSVRSLA